MKLSVTFFTLFIIACGSCNNPALKNPDALSDDQMITIEKKLLKDKIKGAWAGQVIGCTYGGPTEFDFKGTMIPDDHFIPWYDGVFEWWYENAPGLYDDIYMDLTFVEVFQEEGLDAPVSSFADAFANADYWLWHANQAARYNILNGISPPMSGHWKYNPHADDIDFQIEADFAGIMSPGMANTASEICDSIGHIMNYGDGWYGGVYVAAMYSLAFISNNVEFIVKEGLKSIPAESSFHQLISDVIRWYEKYPDDWKMNWFLTQKKWASEVGCPDGVFADFNIDAKINAAYIVIGLLYGKGDFERTVKISTLCGQDSDCNPASAGGILGTMMGYEQIPPEWKLGLDNVENINFKYTDISLTKAYKYSYDQALLVINKFGGKTDEKSVTIKYQSPEPVRYEQGFQGHYPAEFKNIDVRLNSEKQSFSFEFNGNGFVVGGGCPWGTDPSYSGQIEVSVDNMIHEEVIIPADYRTRRHELTWAYALDPGKHVVKIKLLNPEKGKEITATKIIVYSHEKSNRIRPGITIN
ncbi:MAG: ADP-ribosylglycohydrolase family protein [Bacteroidales bacterium]|nr:ADP-ribosylglycohydrolase family protein [Bacteroidales bacterium]